MGNQIEVGADVFTESGHKAIYAGEIDGQKFVRIMLGRDDDEYGYEEWPSDKLTPVSRVLATEPFEVLGEKVKAETAKLAEIREEANAVRSSVLDLQRQEKEWKSSAAKFPQIATTLAFLEGRITHVVIDQYGEISVKRLQDALTYYENGWGRKTENGLKLLCLFGHEKGKAPRWAINQYYDGSGSYTTIDPFESEDAAWAEVRRRADEAFSAWRIDPGKAGHLHRFEKVGVAPQDWLDHTAAVREEARQTRLSKLREEIALLEGGAA